MYPSRSPPTATEFFAVRLTPRRIAQNCKIAALGLLFLYAGIRASPVLLHRGQIMILVGFWVMLAVVIANVPRLVRDRIEADRGEPILRIDERGVWVRDLESFGWIDWADVSDIKVETDASEHRLCLTIRDERKYVARTTWVDWVSIMAARAFGLFGRLYAGGSDDSNARTILVASSLSLGEQWDRLIAILDPILMRHGLPMRELRSASSEPPPSDSETADARPSVIVAQFPNGGPKLRAMIAKLVEVDPAMAGDVVVLARAANPMQQQTIGAALADASNYFTGLGELAWARDADASIRRAMDSADDGTRTGWARAKAPTPAVAPLT